jgi:hypothetical protein
VTDLLRDVWTDLREKRLAPVAVGLLAALVLVPLVLAKGSGDDGAAPAPPKPTSKPSGAATAVALNEEKDSDLGAFSSKNPFKGAPPSSGAATVGPSAAAGAATPPATTSMEPKDGASAGGEPAAEPTGGGSPPAQGAPPSAPAAPAKPFSAPRRPRQTFTVDLRFGQPGRVRSYRHVGRMEPVPSWRRPLLMFLGVTTDRRRAVFAVDGALRHFGEGRCVYGARTANSCTFLYLRADRRHDQHVLFDPAGRQYHLRVTDIERASVKSSARRTKRRYRRARRRAGSSSEVAPLRVPTFLDEVAP